MSKQIEVTTGFLSEEWTIKNALQSYLNIEKQHLSALKLVHGKFVPNQHIYKANIDNCMAVIKKLNEK